MTGAFKAAGNTVPVISLSDDKRILALHGIEVDVISKVTAITRRYTNVEDAAAHDEMSASLELSQARRSFEKRLFTESERLAESCWNFP